MNIGEKAPEFALTASNGSEWRLSDHLGRVTVLLFYPQNETVVCTKQLCSVRDNWNEYLATNAEIVGISPCSQDNNLKFAQSQSLPISILADERRTVTGIYGKHWLFPLFSTRAIIVIDAEGIVRTKSVMLRAFRPNDDDVIRAIYEARGDLFETKYKDIRSRLKRVGLKNN